MFDGIRHNRRPPSISLIPPALPSGAPFRFPVPILLTSRPMSRSFVHLLTAVAAACVLPAGRASAQIGPVTPMFRGNPEHTGVSSASFFGAQGGVRWRAHTGGGVAHLDDRADQRRRRGRIGDRYVQRSRLGTPGNG